MIAGYPKILLEAFRQQGRSTVDAIQAGLTPAQIHEEELVSVRDGR